MMPGIIHRDNDICCRNCGSVLGHESDFEQREQKITMSANLFLLGSAMNKNVTHRLQKSAEQYHEENAIRYILDIAEKYGLPEFIALEVFQHVKKKNHLQSKKEPIKQYIRILSKDDNYLHIHKLRAMKKDYEELLSR